MLALSAFLSSAFVQPPSMLRPQPALMPQPVAAQSAPQMFFGPKGDPVELEIKTFKGVVKAKGTAGQPLIKAIPNSAGLQYGCKEGTCGTCEVKLNGKVVRTCVAKMPNKSPLKVDITTNKLLKSRKNSNW